PMSRLPPRKPGPGAGLLDSRLRGSEPKPLARKRASPAATIGIGFSRRLALSPCPASRFRLEGPLVHAPFPAPAGFRIVSSEEIRDGEGTPARVVHPDPGLRITLAPERPMPPQWYHFALKLPPEGLVHVVPRLSLARE